MAQDKTPFDPEKLAKELQLTEKQRLFCDYYVFTCELDGNKAVDEAGYKFDGKDGYKDYAPDVAKAYINMQKSRKARDLLTTPAVLKYIQAIRENLDQQLIIDKLWVIKKLKTLAENGSENTQLNATKLLGMTMQMFTEVQRIETSDDPAAIVKEAMKKRREEMNKQAIENIPKEDPNSTSGGSPDCVRPTTTNTIPFPKLTQTGVLEVQT